MTVDKVIAKIIWLTFLAHPVVVIVLNRFNEHIADCELYVFDLPYLLT